MTWHRARALVACALSVLAVLPLAARAAGRRAPRGPGRLSAVPAQTAALSPAAAAASVGAVALGASVAWWLAGLLAIPAAVLTAGQLPRRRAPVHRDPALRPVAELRILTLNALFGGADPAATVDAIRDLDVDVLAVQELTPALVRGLAGAGLADLLPSRHVDPDPGAAGAGLFSRFELTPLPSAAGLLFVAPSARITVAGQPVTVRAVHPVAPIMGRQCDWHRDLGHLRDAMLAAEADGPQVVAGDFNASRDHRPFRDILAAGFADSADIARRRPWPGYTWPANRRWPPVMRLDHILVSPGITVSEARTVAIPGTDHRAVLAVLELPRSMAAQLLAAYTQGQRLRI
jgi:endonuclease/exonuclease/phosphatase (EEP) superfamily protein YafD